MHSIRNFVQLTENIGTGGQPHHSQFSIVASNGYGAVLNLAMPDHIDSIATEGEIVSRFGMTYIHLPVPFDKPIPQHVQDFCRFMDALDGRKVFVHCIMNYRVSAFMYHYLSKVKGYGEQESKSAIFKKWEIESQWHDMLLWDSEKIGLQNFAHKLE